MILVNMSVCRAEKFEVLD